MNGGEAVLLAWTGSSTLLEMGGKAVVHHLCSQECAMFPSWCRSPLPNSISFTSASSGHWLPFWRHSHGWVLQNLCYVPVMPVTFSSLSLASSHCSCPTPVHLVAERQEPASLLCHPSSTTAAQTGDSGPGHCPLARPRQQC